MNSQKAVRGVALDPGERGTVGDLTDPRLIQFKGALFLLLGLLAAGILVLDHLSLRTTLLLAISIWSFCRAYYFAFYVIEHYVDAEFRFSGLFDFCLYLAGWKRH